MKEAPDKETFTIYSPPGELHYCKNYLFFVNPFQSSQQKNMTGSDEKFPGAFLTIHELQACSDEVTLLKTFFLNFSS